MRQLTRVVAATVLVLCALACRGQQASPSFRPLDVGAAVPLYGARTLAGDTIRLGGAGEPTVLNVWATWCTSCREEMATLDSAEREFAPLGVRVIGVSVDDGGIERIRRFAVANHLAFTVAHDPDGRIQRAYSIVGVPTTFVIDGEGHLVWQHTGNVSDIPNDLRAAVRRARLANPTAH